MRTFQLAAVFLLLCADLALGEPALVVITHPSRPAHLASEEVARIYLKRKRFWNDGSPIVPINREAGSEERELFEKEFLSTTKLDMVAYWNQRYFHGVFPPATLESDEAVKRYVASDPNAVGYIAADQVDPSVHVVHTFD